MNVNAPTFAVERCPSCGARLEQRSYEQNALLHALIRDIAEQKQWAGEWLDEEDWKRLLIAAYERTQGRSARIYPALDGHGFEAIYRRSSRMSKQEASDLCVYVMAWGAEHGVKFREAA